MITIFDKFKEFSNSIKEPTQGTRDFVEVVKDSINEGTFATKNLDVLANSILDVDKSVVSTEKDVQKGTKTIVDLENSVNSASSSTAAFASTLKNVATNMAIMLAVNLAIKGIAYVIDQAVVTYQELKEAAIDAAEEFNNLKSKSESLNSELKTTRDRIEELEKKPNLTFVEQEELRKLKEANEELERQIELNKTLLGVAETKARDTAVDFLEKKTSYEQYGEWDMSQVLNDNSNYGQRKAGEIFQGNLLEVTKIQLAEYEDLLKRKKDVEKRIQEFQLANPDVDNYTAEQKGQFANLTMELNSYDDTLHALKTTLYEIVPELDSFKASLNPDYDQSYIDSINEIVDGYADLFGDTGKNVTDRFNEVWESTDFSSAREQLEKLSKAGKLTPEVLESNERYQELLEETGKTASEVCQNIHALVEAEGNLGNDSDSPTLFNKQEMISAINDLSEGFEELDKIYSSISDKKPFDFKLLDDDKFKETFSGLGDAYTYFIETVSNSPNDITECQEAFDELLTVWLNSSPVLKNVSEDTAALTTSMLSNMGVANAEQIVTQALADNHARLAAEKYYEATASAALEGATANEVARILQEAEAAGIDAQELARIAIGKMAANGVQVNTAGDIANILALSNAAWDSVGALQALANAKSGVFGASAGIAASVLDIVKNVGKSKHKYHGSYGGGNKSNKSGGSGGGSGSGSEKEPTVFNFMDKKIENLNTEIDKLKDNMDSVAGYKNKNSFADSIIQDYERQIEIYNQMIAEYQKKANEISLPTEYIEKIKNGAIEIESISDEALVKQIQDYQKWQKEIDDCSKSIYDIKNNIQDLKYEKIDNIIDQYDDLNQSMKDVIDTQENLIELMEESGEQSVGIDDYEGLVEKQVSYAEQNAEAIEKVRDEMRRLNVMEESDKWMDYNEQIKDYESNMISAAKAVEKYKDKMVELTYKVLDDYQSKMDIINNTVSTMHDLIGDEHLLDDDGQLTNRGMAQVALYAQELAHAKQTAEEYAHAMHSLDEVLSEGLITEDEYNEKLKDYRASQEDAVAATKKAQEAILDLIKDSIQAEID